MRQYLLVYAGVSVDLKLRELRISDFDSCFELLASPWQCDPSEREALRAMWREVLEQRCGAPAIALDAREPEIVVHFGLLVFVSDARAQEYRQCATPLISRRMLAEWASGGRPFLNYDEVARANAGPGLNIVVSYYGRRRGDPRVYTANYESSRVALSGWNLRSLTTEVFTDPARNDREFGQWLGYRILEYPDERVRDAGIPLEERPFLWAATREEDEERPHYGSSLVFGSYAPPRLSFTPLEQQLLQFAINGATDAVISREPGISLSVVKKHFRSIAEKARDAGILDEIAAAPSSGTRARGDEIRRHVLNYVRDHPEELRPYDLRPAQRGNGAIAAPSVEARRIAEIR